MKQPTDTCEILGKLEVPTYGLLDSKDPSKGLFVQYGGGDKCTNGDNPSLNGKPRQSKFNIHCASKQDENVFIINYFFSLLLIYPEGPKVQQSAF